MSAQLPGVAKAVRASKLSATGRGGGAAISCSNTPLVSQNSGNVHLPHLFTHKTKDFLPMGSILAVWVLKT